MKGKPIPDDVDALVIAGPKQPISERAKFVIDQFLMQGKSVAFFVDGMIFETPQQMQMPGQGRRRRSAARTIPASTICSSTTASRSATT